MTQNFALNYAFAALGTGATLLVVLLLLMRAKFQGRRPFVALARRWVAAGTRTSSLVIGPLAAIAVFCFARMPAHNDHQLSGAADQSVHANALFGQSISSGSQENAPAGQDLESLRAYAEEISGNRQPPATAPPASKSTELPDVDTMIAKLAARLEKQPDDVKGWKILGWSYLNMERSEEAARAYETALKLDPNDPEIKKGLQAAKSAQMAAIQSSPPGLESSTAADDPNTANGHTDIGSNRMVRGMVDQLATRLETSPHDEDGWLRLMRSRMTLGEKDAAIAALTKALETFSGDSAAKQRLTASARELGLESN